MDLIDSYLTPPPPSPEDTLGSMGERGLLRRLARFMSPEGAELVVGYGDDAAVWDPDPARQEAPLLIVTTDTMVEGTHFRPEWCEWEDVGRKLVATNVSDIAAMGGLPSWALLSLACPADTRTQSIENLYNGMKEECGRWNCALIGGDTVRGPVLTLTLTVLGHKKRSASPCRRDSLRAGQHLFVTGWPGESGAGLRLLQYEGSDARAGSDWKRRLVLRHLLPTPRPRVGWELARALPDLAMIDLSDGVDNELRLLSQASGFRLVVDLDRLPVSLALRRMKEAHAEFDPLRSVLFGGEDYELLFATMADRETVSRLVTAADANLAVHEIGRVTDALRGGNVEYLDAHGNPVVFSGERGFQHF